MKSIDKYISDICTKFQQNHGRACCYCFPPTDYRALIYTIYNKYTQKRPNSKVLIVVDKYDTRVKVIDYLKEHNATEETGFKYNVLSADYIKHNFSYNYEFIITIGVNTQTNVIDRLSKDSKFMLSVFTVYNKDNEFNTLVRRLLPLISSDVNELNIRQDLISSPVEIYPISVILKDDDRTEYDKCNEFISTTVKVFGDFDSIQKARVGDARLNISSQEIREMIAHNNGWSLTLDTSIEFNRQIDEIYNPSALLERANLAYNVMSLRRNLVSDNNNKLEAIKDIIVANSNKRIIIVSKRGEFAAAITKYLNENEIACGDYHDCIEQQAMIDENTNDYIRYKSGTKKGEIKYFGSDALSTYFLGCFNDKQINCLSIKNSSNSKLKTAIDILIFTSPLCDDIVSFKQRFTNIEFTSTPNKVYLIYTESTIEQDKLISHYKKGVVSVIENDDEKNIVIDENNGNVIL